MFMFLVKCRAEAQAASGHIRDQMVVHSENLTLMGNLNLHAAFGSLERFYYSCPEKAHNIRLRYCNPCLLAQIEHSTGFYRNYCPQITIMYLTIDL